MQYIIFCILANVGIFLCFRGFSYFKMNTFQAIVINYLVCVITGVFFIGDVEFLGHVQVNEPWVIVAMILGAVFIVAFYIMAITTQRMGITVASIASKMSLVIPVVVSMWVLMIKSKEYAAINYIGIALAVIAILLASVKKRGGMSKMPSGVGLFILPLTVFILGGAIDTTINYTNHKFLPEGESAVFVILIFGSAFLLGAVWLGIRKSQIESKNIVGGAVLGIINYFSLYFLVKALTAFNNDGAVVYPVLNVGIILVSSLLSVIIFREKLLAVNKFGLLLAVLAVIFIFYQEISAFW